MAELKRTVVYSSRDKMPVPAQTQAEGYERFFKAAHATLMPETFNTLCVRSGIDAIKQAPKASLHGPCWECRFFDAEHCHKWAADVPKVAQIDGCAEHRAVVYTNTAQVMKQMERDGDLPPF